ncbi:DNA-binding IclR family transcriptional regulator [Pararhizobium capsulatum DSM 1112]|uniref:DNA-binding IclR family transcriptional regulator n=1 Tax=Pararhizobium capsulatum DSM 1112 TaxID=1121113 RepID=A0ABU0C0N3_9HYPH|nr:IclR family transcriptional regulator [Pararhizobium capsulatum]MDQ0324091.1 DNA-binding IclR family transcriptional regulator [Pararhizobium capsulatum DSM 1112]
MKKVSKDNREIEAAGSLQEGSPLRSAYSSELRQSGNRWLLTAQDDDVSPQSPAPGLVPAVENAIGIVNYINRAPAHMASLTEILSVLPISKSHCHSILKTLTYFGWLKFDARTKAYQLNSGLLASASSLLGSPVLDAIRRELQLLVQRAEIPAVLSQPQDDDTFIVVDKFNGAQSMEVSFPIGHHFPRDATANMRAYLAWQPETEIDRWMKSWRPVRYTSTTMMTEKEVRAEIAATRKRGYARSIGELTEGLMALGMPIFGRHGEVIYTFTCSGLLSTIAPREELLARELVRTAVSINQAILGRVPNDFPAG